jgi:hypothetical protein
MNEEFDADVKVHAGWLVIAVIAVVLIIAARFWMHDHGGSLGIGHPMF